MKIAKRSRFSLGFALLLAICMAGSALAKEPVFNTVDVPGASNTALTGINAEGDIVGGYVDANHSSHGFLLGKGVVTNIDLGRYTYVAGINSEGEIVGYFGSATGDHGFLLTRGVVSSINVPSDSSGGIYPPNSHAMGINSQGDIVGDWQLALPGATHHGFLLMKGAFISIDFPGTSYTEARGINSAGDIVGNYVGENHRLRGFLLSKGKFALIDVPGASTTIVTGINSRGDIVGYYMTSDNSLHGFLLSKGEFTTIDVPGASTTIVNGINSGGDIVGSYELGVVSHGFLLSK